MKVLVVVMFSIFAGATVKAETINSRSGEVYVGLEAVNEHLTGNKCFITINSVAAFAEKGMHCHKVGFQFATNRLDVPKDFLSVESRITNYHRAEYPKVKTCALNIDGTSSGDEIYAEDTSRLYNQIFGGMHTSGGVRYDYFLTFAPNSKLPVRARMHIMETFQERDVECVRLEKM
jgi:hypothetical protein